MGMIYSIIDVETTGQTNRITEISIFKYDGNKVIDEYTTLVNPGEVIPVYVTVLTNIDNATVANAPYFKDIAQSVLDFTKDTVFVAHNVNFDYKMIGGEFKRLGLSFNRDKLCTVRLSRALFKGLPSYSLGKLCKSLNIPLKDRHRARGDAEATVVLFQKLLNQEDALFVFESHLLAGKKNLLPKGSNLRAADFDKLPNHVGIYILYNSSNDVIFVGRAKNIKKSVLNIFNSKKKKDVDMCAEVVSVDFKCSGHDAIAQLMELDVLAKNQPKYNVVKRVNSKTYSIFNYTDRSGVMHLSVNITKLAPFSLKIFASQKDAFLFLNKMCATYNLCPKYTVMQSSLECTSALCKTGVCYGVCEKKESVEVYNGRVNKAINYLKDKQQNNVIKLNGRDVNENAFLLIADGVYKGYGFVSKDEDAVLDASALESYVVPQEFTLGVQRVLCSLSSF